MNEHLASWNDGPARAAIVDFVDRVTDRGRPGPRSAAGARRRVRQRRHAVVREADADRARLHPAAPGRDGGDRRVAARAAAVEGGARPRLRLARRRDDEALQRRRERREAADRRRHPGLRGLGGRRLRGRRRRVPGRGAPPDARPPAPRLRLPPDGRAAALPRGPRVHHLHRLRRRPRLHAPLHRGALRHPARARDRQLERAALPGGRATAARSSTSPSPTSSTTARSSRCGSGAASAADRSSPAATPTATSRCCASPAGRAGRRCACSSARRRRARVPLHGGAEQALDAAPPRAGRSSA